MVDKHSLPYHVGHTSSTKETQQRVSIWRVPLILFWRQKHLQQRIVASTLLGWIAKSRAAGSARTERPNLLKSDQSIRYDLRSTKIRSFCFLIFMVHTDQTKSADTKQWVAVVIEFGNRKLNHQWSYRIRGSFDCQKCNVFCASCIRPSSIRVHWYNRRNTNKRLKIHSKHRHKYIAINYVERLQHYSFNVDHGAIMFVGNAREDGQSDNLKCTERERRYREGPYPMFHERIPSDISTKQIVNRCSIWNG